MISLQQTRGNQRDIDRARAQKRKEKYAKDSSADGLTPSQRKERYIHKPFSPERMFLYDMCADQDECAS